MADPVAPYPPAANGEPPLIDDGEISRRWALVMVQQLENALETAEREHWTCVSSSRRGRG